MHPVHVLAHFVQTAAQSVPQVTTNPNAGDTWINRLAVLLPTFAALYAAVRAIRKGYRESVTEIVDDRVSRVEAALRTHTDQEAAIVKSVVEEALRPVVAMQNQLAGQVATLTTLANRADARAES